MSRKKGVTTKLISPENEPERNLRITQLGDDMTDEPAFDAAYCWRFRLLLLEWEKKNAKRKHLPEIDRAIAGIHVEIAEAVAEALRSGNPQFPESLARCTRFINERCNWKAGTFADFSQLLTLNPRRFRFAEPLRSMIAQEYFFTSSAPLDEKKKTKKAFMEHVASLEIRSVERTGKNPQEAFRKAFERACEDLGIRLE